MNTVVVDTNKCRIQNMANGDQETGLLPQGDVPHPLSDSTNSVYVDTSNEQSEQGVNEEVLHRLRQALANANPFESTSISYSVTNEEPQVCDTGQETENSGIKDTETHSQASELVSNTETIIPHSHTSEPIFSNGEQDTLLTNSTPEVLGLDTNEGYTVGSIPEGHIISIPNDMISDSAIITENGDGNLQNSIEISENADVHLLQDESQQQLDLVGQVESSDYGQQSSEMNILQPGSGTEHQLLQSGAFPQAHHAITLSAPSGMSMTPEVLQTVLQQVQAQHLARQQQGPADGAQSEQVKEEPPTSSLEPVSTSATETVNFTVVSPSQSVSDTSSSVAEPVSVPPPPLGSSQNPIRIIQQGNRYTPMQQLSPEQLQQIMQVVQQQHVNKNTQDNGGAIIFNPQTNTRIMYRVIYPAELHKTQTQGGHTTYQVVRPSTASQEQQTGAPHQKRPYRKRKDLTAVTIAVSAGPGGEQQEDKDKGPPEGPELSKEEKEERKKHRPRTRSGRVSKPPKHMVQDYKHIHVLDWDEDYDDSDGGYSDFKHSDEEGGKIKLEGVDEEQQPPKSPDLFSGLGAVRPKNHKCAVCDKSYIGQAGLARHYRLNPDHCTVNPSEDGSISSLHNGSADGEDSKDVPLAHDGSLSRLSDSALDTSATPGGPNSGSTNLETFSEDSNTQDSLNSTGAPSPHTVLGMAGQAGALGSQPQHRGRGRGRFRGRWAHLKYNAQMRRKNKLKEFIKQCSDEELMEIVLPRLVTSISLWEFLLMKSEKGGARPQIDAMYREYESLTQHVRQACSAHLQPLSQEELEDDSLQCKMIKVADKRLAVCLDLEPVTYRVKDVSAGDCNTFSSLHNKLSAAAITRPQQETGASALRGCLESENDAELKLNGGQKRPLESMDTFEDGMQQAAKRPRISTLSIPTSNVPSGLFTVRAHLPTPQTSSVEDTLQDSSSQSHLSASLPSCGQSLLPSSQAAIRIMAPSHISMSSSSSPSTIPSASSTSSTVSSLSLLSKPTTTLGSSARSPFVHISRPIPKQQASNGTHLLIPASSSSSSQPSQILPSPGQCLLVNAVNGNNQVKSQVVPVATGGLQTGRVVSTTTATSTTTSILSPLLAGSGVGVAGSHRFVLAGAPGSQTLLTQHAAAGPGTALLLAAGAAAGGNNRVLVRHPAPAAATNKHSKPVKLSQQASGSSFRSLLTPSTIVGPATVITKPTEVKVSRQLFHDATLSSSSSSLLGSSKATSLLTNGKASTAPSTSAGLPQASGTLPPMTSTLVFADSRSVDTKLAGSVDILPSIKVESDPPGVNTNSSTVNNSKTLETPPSGQQFVASPNKTANTSNHEAVVIVGAPNLGSMTDMDVMGLEFPPVDDLGPTLGSTPTDSFNGSFASTSSTVVTTMVAGSHFLNHSQVNTMADSLLTSHKPNGDLISNGKLPVTCLNGHAQNSTSSLLSSSSSLPNTNNTSSVLDHNSLKSLASATVKTNLNHAANVVATNGSLFSSHPMKVESNVMVSDPPEQPFSTQAGELQSEAAASYQFNNGDISSISHSEDLSSQMENAVSEDLPASSHLAQGMTEGELEQESAINSSAMLAAGDGSQQLLLSEGTNIYQTEDGTLFIQSANGNTYQLQGAQGLPLETVQALLSGTLDQLAN